MTLWLLRGAPVVGALLISVAITLVLQSFASGMNPAYVRPASAMAILAPLFLLAVMLRTLMNGPWFRDAALGASTGLLAVVFWTTGLEWLRLDRDMEGEWILSGLLDQLNVWMLAAAAAGLCFSLWFLRMATGYAARPGQGARPARRAPRGTWGTADWMSERVAADLFPDGPGIVIGENYRPDLDRSAGPVFDPGNSATWGRGGRAKRLCFNGQFGSTHGLVFAGSGGYKTTAVVIPTALNWQGSMVVLDPSREVAPMVGERRVALGRRVLVLDPATPELGFNVLDWIAGSGSPEESIAATAAWLMADKPAVATGSDDFFRNSARQLITGVLADIMLSGKTPEEQRTLRHMRSVIASPEPDLRKRLAEIYDSSPSSFVRETLAPFIQMTETTFSGVYANAAKDTQWISFERLGQLVSGGQFASSALRDGNTDIFINLDLKTLQTHPGIGRVIAGALLNSLYEAGGDVRDRTLFLFDEAFLLGRMDILQTARDAGRKYGITLLMIYQGIGQLIDTWGPQAKPSWFESTSFRIFAAVSDPKTAEELSAACGDYTVETVTRTGPGLLTGHASRSRSVSDQGRRLILPHEILQDMRADEQLVFVQGQRPLRCGRAIYFRRPEMVGQVKANRFAPGKADG